MPTLLVKNAALIVTMDAQEHELQDAAVFCRDGFIEQISAAADLPSEADEVLVRAAREFNAEAITLDKAQALLGWNSPAQDPARNQKLWPLLSKARDHYAAGIVLLEQALPLMK